MEIALPHNFSPREYQIPFLRAMDSGVIRAVLVWPRRAGKDKVSFCNLVRKAFQRVGNYYYFFPTSTLARQALWENIDNDGFRTLDHIPKEVVRGMNETEMRIDLKNGSTIRLIGSDKFEERAIGTNPVGMVFSEYPVTEPHVWDYARPILAANGGWAVFNFTPRGMNHGWKIVQQAKQEPGWFCQVLTVDDTKHIQPEVLASEKRQMPQDLFEQEYYCKFIEGAGQFFRRITDNVHYEDIQPQSGRFYTVGADIAKHQDWNVLTPIDLHTFKVAKQERFNQLDWPTIEAKIEACTLRWNGAKLRIDATGVGDPVHDHLALRVSDIDPFKISSREVRTRLLTNLAIVLQNDKIKIPNDEGLVDELRSFRYELTPNGSVDIRVPEGMTDDRVFSLALAVWGIPNEPLPMKVVSKFHAEFGPSREEYDPTVRFHYDD